MLTAKKHLNLAENERNGSFKEATAAAAAAAAAKMYSSVMCVCVCVYVVYLGSWERNTKCEIIMTEPATTATTFYNTHTHEVNEE